jgi:hypothetical protein
VFAALTLFLLGTANLIEGLAAVGNPRFFIHHPRPFLDNLIVWGYSAPHSTPASLAVRGWIGVLVGPAEVAIGCGVLVKNQLSRASGMVVLGLHASAQLVVMRPDSRLSAATFTLDLLAVYALTRYGSQGKEGPSRQMTVWRRSAADVTRAWSEWLTAADREGGERYRRYVCALAEEERAAGELERAINRGGADSENRRGQEFPSCDGPRAVQVTRRTRADDPASVRGS